MAVKPQVLVGAGAVLAVVLAAGGAWFWQRRRAARSLPARLRRAALGVLEAFLLPHAETGQIHIPFALLTRRGILVLDVRDVEGHVFGSEAMQEWTVLAGRRRYTFSNPLQLLYDRIAAVRRVLPDVPVDGCIGFTARAQFPKGLPPSVVMIERLLADLPAGTPDDDVEPAILRAAWERLRAEADGQTEDKTGGQPAAKA
jgi:hypothetical protein